MPSKLLRTGLITAALAIAPTYLVAQEGAAPAAAPAAPSEVEQIQARITQVQQQAAQDSAVQAALAAVNTAREAADPEFKTLTERAISIKNDIAAAQAAQDNAKLRELAAEVNQLNTNLAAARARTEQNAEVQAKNTAYRTALLRKMVEIDPEIQQLITRLNTLRQGGPR